MTADPVATVARWARWFVGSWSGPEVVAAGADGAARAAVGRWEVAWICDGRFLAVDYVEEIDGVAVFRGHGVHGWDADLGGLVAWWFDAAGTARSAAAALAEGADGAVLRYAWARESGATLFTYALSGESFRFTIDAPDGTRVHDGAYTRAPTPRGP